MLFKEVELEDLEELSALYYLCFNINTDINQMKNIYLNIHDLYAKSFILKINKKIVGHIKCDIINNIFGNSKPYMYFSDICIHPDYRGKGYSRILLKNAENWAKENNCSHIFLNSSTKREVAHNLYNSMGYEKRESSIFKKNI